MYAWTLPVLVGNNRAHVGGVGCELVITYQETGLLHLPATVQVGPPLMWRWSKVNLTPSRLGGGWEVEQPNEGCLRSPPAIIHVVLSANLTPYIQPGLYNNLGPAFHDIIGTIP